MKLLFQKTLLIICVLLLSSIPVFAGTLTVQSFASPIKLANKISQPISINFATDGAWKLLVESLDNRAVNQDNPRYFIPMTKVELAEVGGNPISNFDLGKTIEIKNGETYGINNFNLALNAALSDNDRPGSYVADIKFTLFNKNAVVAEEIFCFRFRQEEISSIEFSQKVINLQMDKEKVLEKNCSQNIPNPLGIYIRSNKDWKLYMSRVSFSKDSGINYYFKVLGGDSSITLNSTNDYIFLNSTPILVASGKSTINESMNYLDRKLINIDYKVKGPENDLLPVGSFSEDFEYRLVTED